MYFVSHDVKRIGSVDCNGWHVTAWRVTGGYRVTASQGHTSHDTMLRESLPEAWRVLRPHLV